ncbi:monovalent cation/H+ antiporter subunit D [Paracoccus sp. MBLB3053]|uniref:Monovalent cation/H+ antiporter subunit D n=1 Tax=Paracoccus aurantius TaxID=3073814 RepID=A0ABU2HTC5_9RHOB|nr:monovalent cation/H+ antiporter subunit D [Paracoccus sp. MBLB3053]MDS9468301.1 monovalent cation/H+ antiporter subunit D [Paracoccus sp. MBLB3053]
MTPEALPNHMIIAPILIPLIAGAIMLFYNDRNRQTKLLLGLAAVGLMFLSSVELLEDAKALNQEGGALVQLYRLGDWPVPVGIVLVLDRLSAMMVMLMALLAGPSLIYAAAGWHGKGQHYHSMFQFLLAGVNGAFLTGDLFNLFVFFEVMLAASYGLMLHGSGPDRIKAGLQYIAVNLAASLFFLIGVALVYGTTGTLNMADIARELTTLEDAQRLLFHAAAAFLGMAFLIKAAAWPLCFWLPPTYAAASPPAAAIMAIMTKVGIYVILRLSLLILGREAGASAGFGAPVLMIAGALTMAFGTVGVLGTPDLARKGGYIAIISSGTILGAIGLAQAGGGADLLGGALYYLVGSTAAVSAFFLISEPVSRNDTGEDEPHPHDEGASLHLAERWEWTPMGLDTVEDTPSPASTRTVSWLTMAICFSLIAAMLAGLPPMPGFVGKVAILRGAISQNIGLSGQLPVMLWVYTAMMILSGLGALIALIRFGIRRFWAQEGPAPRILALEIVPVVMLLGMLLLLTLRADAVLSYARDTAVALLEPATYRKAVLQDAARVDATPPENLAPIEPAEDEE